MATAAAPAATGAGAGIADSSFTDKVGGGAGEVWSTELEGRGMGAMSVRAGAKTAEELTQSGYPTASVARCVHY